MRRIHALENLIFSESYFYFENLELRAVTFRSLQRADDLQAWMRLAVGVDVHLQATHHCDRSKIVMPGGGDDPIDRHGGEGVGNQRRGRLGRQTLPLRAFMDGPEQAKFHRPARLAVLPE